MSIKESLRTHDVTAQLSYQPVVKAFFHQATYTFSYVVHDPATNEAAVIDSVLDFNLHTGRLSHDSAQVIIDYVTANALKVVWHLETHMHADHLSAASYLREQLGGKTAIGRHVMDVQGVYKDVFGVADDVLAEARDRFDHLWDDFETFSFGQLPALTFCAPGHTPADIVYAIGDALFVGDSLFMPDFGSARCDFPHGSAADMYDAVQLIYTLPETMRMFMCHDYLPAGRSDYRYETTVRAQKEQNIHLHTGVQKADFVSKREARDATLPLPKLMIPSLQVNMRAGALPQVNGKAMLQLPINSVFAKYVE